MKYKVGQQFQQMDDRYPHFGEIYSLICIEGEVLLRRNHGNTYLSFWNYNRTPVKKNTNISQEEFNTIKGENGNFKLLYEGRIIPKIKENTKPNVQL